MIWYNGSIIMGDSMLHSPGLLIGDGLFETLAVYNGVPFALTEHLSRLEASMCALQYGPLQSDTIKHAVAELSATHTHTNVSRLRITVWRDVDGQSVSIRITPALSEAPSFATVNTHLATAATSRFIRNEHSALTGHKSTSYAENAYALREATTSGASEAILCNTVGDLCEGTTSNIVVDLNGELVTPALSSGCLPGVTRHLALDWAAEAGLALREAEPGELTRSIVGKPLALLGTLRNVQQVSRWDGSNLPHSEALLELARVFAGNMHKVRTR